MCIIVTTMIIVIIIIIIITTMTITITVTIIIMSFIYSGHGDALRGARAEVAEACDAIGAARRAGISRISDKNANADNNVNDGRNDNTISIYY